MLFWICANLSNCAPPCELTKEPPRKECLMRLLIFVHFNYSPIQNSLLKKILSFDKSKSCREMRNEDKKAVYDHTSGSTRSRFISRLFTKGTDLEPWINYPLKTHQECLMASGNVLATPSHLAQLKFLKTTFEWWFKKQKNVYSRISGHQAHLHTVIYKSPGLCTAIS